MTARVTNADVAKILPAEFVNDDFATFIASANLLVNEELASAGLSAARLTQIELYLSAHFAIITLEKGGLTRQKIGESEDFFQTWTNTAVGLNATRYGQQATTMDTSGKLAALASGKLRASFSIVGSPNDNPYYTQLDEG